ncbi:hypothetical protein KEJ18_02495 [Candidatus Bathyarchaeota archaeon]|nr:hypothetical protein [Candidatus Bathyarchaeota archaeon]
MSKDAEEVEKVLKTVSEMVPNLVKGVISAIFSADAGKEMGAAAANFYKELKAGGLPEDVAVKMTQDYIKTFTDIGSLMKEVAGQKGGLHIEHHKGENLSKEIEEQIRKKIEEKQAEKKE